MHTSTHCAGRGRVHAFMDQRVIFDGMPMVRAEAWRMQAAKSGWAHLDTVIALPESPIDGESGWSPPTPDDLDIQIEDEILRQRLNEALREEWREGRLF